MTPKDLVDGLTNDECRSSLEAIVTVVQKFDEWGNVREFIDGLQNSLNDLEARALGRIT